MFENAKHRSEANDVITEHDDELFIHLTKVWLFPSFEAENHWVGEIAKFIKRAPLMKSSKKPMDADIIEDLMKDDFNDNGAYYYLDKAIEEEPDLVPVRGIYDSYDINDFSNRIDKFIEKYSKKLREVAAGKNKSGIDRIKAQDIYKILRSDEVGIL